MPREFSFDPRTSGSVTYVHRSTAEGEVYFVSNQEAAPVSGVATFRVKGKAPELWQPESGKREQPAVWSERDGMCQLPMALGSGESVFVVFRERAGEHLTGLRGLEWRRGLPEVEVTRVDGRYFAWYHGFGGGETIEGTMSSGRSISARLPELPAPVKVEGGWKVAFPNGAATSYERLESWSKHAEEAIRYFSGTATYRREIDVAAGFLAGENEAWLELGEVQNIAEVVVNGRNAGICWKPPYAVEVRPLLKEGKNSLEVRVTNTWANRLIGDEKLPDDCAWGPVTSRGAALKEWPAWVVKGLPRPSKRQAFATWKFYDAEAQPLPAGLLGPVTLKAVGRVEMK